ncbi:MAG: helix-turn-helix domain-containing protein [Chloroflexota bacterium]
MTKTEWITTAQAAKISGYHLIHLRRLLRAGEIEGQKFGTVWQVSKQSLETYLETAVNSNDKRWGPKP